jgi:hypothetical protein
MKREANWLRIVRNMAITARPAEIRPAVLRRTNATGQQEQCANKCRSARNSESGNGDRKAILVVLHDCSVMWREKQVNGSGWSGLTKTVASSGARASARFNVIWLCGVEAA